MNKRVPNLFLGCLVAPLAAPVAMLLIILVVGKDLRGATYEYGLNNIKEMFWVLGIFIIFGAPIAYAITAVLGVPIYLISQKLGYINFWSITCGAAFVAILPLLIMSAPNGFVLYQEPEKSSFLLYSAVALCGYVVGLVFWFVSGLHTQHAHYKPWRGRGDTAHRHGRVSDD